MTLRLTGTGLLFLAATIAFYLAALTSQSGLLLLLAGVTLGCLLVNFASAWNVAKNLEIHAPSGMQICEGERLCQPWRVSNRGKRAAAFVRAELSHRIIIRLRELSAGASVSMVPDLSFKRRGVFVLTQLNLVSIAPFGLVKVARRCRSPGEVVVGPAIYPARAPQAAGYEVTLGGKYKGHRPITSGTYFAGVRPFQDGDPLKQIHWKSSAKGLGLMVKTFEEELSGRISFILDNGRAGRPDNLDDCARAAGSLMFAALEAGHHLELIDLERLEPLRVPPSSDGVEILDALARLPLGSERREARVRAALELVSKRGALCFVLTEFEPETGSVIQELVNHRRQVSLCLPAAAGRPDIPANVAVFGYSEKDILPMP